MRPIWKGSISFGLVNIPVGLFSATRPGREVKFRMLRDKDLSPIHYKRVAETDGQEVPWENIVKGYEHEKGEFVVITDKDFEQVEIKSNQTVDIREFVDLEEIDPMFFDKPYFLAPEKGGAKAYGLLRDALKESGKVGIAKVAIRTREHIAAVKPHGEALVLELMHFPEELADPKTLELPKMEVGKKELEMAQSLVDTMSDKWEPEKYKDEYHEALMELIQKKIAAGGKELPKTKTETAKPTNVVDLVSVLQESLRAAAKGKGKEETAHRTAKAKAKSASTKKHKKAA
ncbi:MAG TPA: Ku protein [Methylomirabilota bacterium]|nr:Ku protein [Methylomirabilota bacterium]